jgi:DNA invertase Pin-like site-specific DNA recombinase
MQEILKTRVVVGYSRVSRAEQAEGQSLEQQTARLVKAGCTEVIEEIGSGRKDQRPEFNKLIEACRRGEIHCVVATRLDRISRSLKTAIGFVELLDSLGVELKILDDSFNFATAGGKLQAGMLSLLSQFESDRLEERVRHGWQHLRDSARAINPPFGYCIQDDKFKLDYKPFLCLLENKQELTKAEIAQDILKIFFKAKSLRGTIKVINRKYGIERYQHGNKKGQIARGLFRWSPSGLSHWLKSPVLAGHTCYLRVKNGQRQPKDNWEIIYNTHPTETLITAEQAADIEAILVKNKRDMRSPFPSRKSALSGLVYCAKCRGNCHLQLGSRGKTPGYNFYYQCKNSTFKACSSKQCVRIEKIEQAVINALVKFRDAVPFEVQAQRIKENPNQIKWQSLWEERNQLYKMNSSNPAIQNAIRQLDAQIQELEAIMDYENRETLELEEFLDLVEKLQINCNTDEPFLFSIDCKEVLHKLIKQVWIEEGTVKSVELNLVR